MSDENVIFMDAFAVKVDGNDVNPGICKEVFSSELIVDNWNDNCEAKSEAKSPRPLRGLQVDSSLTRNVPYAVR